MILTRESAHEMLTSGACTVCALEFSEVERVAYLSASCEEKLCAGCYALREHAQTASDIGASTRELDIRARERRAFPSRRMLCDAVLAMVREDERGRAAKMLAALLIDQGAPEDAEPMARCKQCGHIFDLPVLICECPRPECKSRYIERVVI